jgi:hypothetical protein
MSPSSAHCRYPMISDHHPFAGTQHLRFQKDPLGGNPAGCTGFGSACRQRAITSQEAVADISRTIWSFEISWEQTLGSNMIQVMGQDTSVGSVFFVGYVQWTNLGYMFVYDFYNAGFVFGGYFTTSGTADVCVGGSNAGNSCDADNDCNTCIGGDTPGAPCFDDFDCEVGGTCTIDGSCPQVFDRLGQYVNFTADINPCDDTVTYSYGGEVVLTTPMGFNPPLGDQTDDIIAPMLDSAFYTTNHFNGYTDIDEHRVTYIACTDACCNGVTGECRDDATALDCAGPSDHYYPNVLCSQLGTDPKYPPACDRDTGACCDRTPDTAVADPAGICTDDVLPEDCVGAQLTFSKLAACAAVAGFCNVGDGGCDATGFCNYGHGKIGAACVTAADCAVAGFCTAGQVGDLCWGDSDCDVAGVTCLEDTGSCCDSLYGECTEDVLAADCVGEWSHWTKLGACTGPDAVACDEDLGACCDSDPFGACTDTTTSECTCSTCTWTKGASCDNTECLHSSIPTVSEWGLVVLTLLLLTGAKVYFGRREAVA